MRYNKTRRHKTGGARQELQTLLTTVAVSDAAHDFGTGITQHHESELIQGIPYKRPYKIISDNDILSHITMIDSEGSRNELSIDHILDVESAFNALGNEYTLQFSPNITRSYTISSLMVDGMHGDEIADAEAISQLLMIPYGLIVDSLSYKLFKGLKKGSPVGDALYVLYNREMINDPAHKHRLTTKEKTDQTGYTLYEAVDIDRRPVIYTRWTNKPSYAYNELFFSNYNIQLDIDPVYDMSTNLYFKDRYNRTIKTITNSKEDNNINTILEVLETDSTNIDILFQQKRSGDALQALSTTQYNRQYNNGYNSSEYTPILVTLDRILLYYSLLLGIDVLFTTIRGGRKYLILFDSKENKIDMRGGHILNNKQTLKNKYKHRIRYKNKNN